MNARVRAIRLMMVTCVMALVATPGFAADASYEVVDPDGIYFRSVRGKHPKAPATIAADTVWAAIPEYRKIIEDDLTEDDARYHLLLKKATARFNKALKKLAKRDSYDMIAEVGAIEAQGEAAKEIPDVTDDLVELVSRD